MVAVYAYFEISDEDRTIRADLRSDLATVATETSALLSKVDPATGREMLRLPPDLGPTIAFPPEAEVGPIEVRWIDFAAASGAPDAPAVAADVIGRLPSGAERVVEQGGRMYCYRGFNDSRGHAAAIEASQSTAYIDRAVKRVAIATIGLVGLILVLGLVFAHWLGTRVIARPMRRLMDRFRRVGAGDLTPVDGPRSHDEMGELTAELDTMIGHLSESRALVEQEHAARLAAVDQLRHADRLTTVGKLASGMAHELGTPLNVISGYAKLIATGQETGAGATESAQIISEQTPRVTDIVRQLLDFARRGELKLVVEDVRPTLARALAMVTVVAKARHVRVRYHEPDEPLVINMDDGKLQQVVVNLAINAVQASAAGAEIELGAQRITTTPPNPDHASSHARPYVRIDIIDHGHGIASEHLARVFEPFFTTKTVGEGTGLGLAVSHGIVEEHHGWIEVASELGRGARFSVYLPATASSASEAAA